QEANQHGRDAHDHQGQDEHAFAADAVAKMAEYYAAKRARDEADGKRRVSKQNRNQRILHREKKLGEDDTRDRPVQEEIVPFDGSPDQTRDDDAPEVPIRYCRYCHGLPCPFICPAFSSAVCSPSFPDIYVSLSPHSSGRFARLPPDAHQAAFHATALPSDDRASLVPHHRKDRSTQEESAVFHRAFPQVRRANFQFLPRSMLTREEAAVDAV